MDKVNHNTQKATVHIELLEKIMFFFVKKVSTPILMEVDLRESLKTASAMDKVSIYLLLTVKLLIS